MTGGGNLFERPGKIPEKDGYDGWDHHRFKACPGVITEGHGDEFNAEPETA